MEEDGDDEMTEYIRMNTYIKWMYVSFYIFVVVEMMMIIIISLLCREFERKILYVGSYGSWMLDWIVKKGENFALTFFSLHYSPSPSLVFLIVNTQKDIKKPFALVSLTRF